MHRHGPIPLSYRQNAAVSSFDPGDNSVEVCFTAGATVRRRGPDGFFDEELIVTPQSVRLGRLNSGAPFLNTHSDFGVEDVLGSVVPGTARIEGGKGFARVRLSTTPSDADNVAKIRDGIVRNVSVGYAIHRVEKIDAAAGDVPVWRVVDWEPYEISAVPIPADPGAQVRGFDMSKRSPATIPDAPLRARRDAMVGAILSRFDQRKHPLTADGREFIGETLSGIARAALEAAGVNTRGLYPSEIVDRAMTSSDMPALLADVAHKSLQRAYQLAPATWKPFVNEIKVPDFKPHSLVQIGGAPQLALIGENGEYQSGGMVDGKEVVKLASYGRMVSMTRQMIINDDLGAITRIPDAFGSSAANLESDLVWGIVSANLAMADGVALFHANHKNLAASGSAIGIASVSAGRAAMAQQKAIDGVTPLSISAAFILVPSAKATAAEQFVGATFPVQVGDVVPPTLRRLQVISEPRLDLSSTARWYLAGDPTQVDTIAAATLIGQDGAHIESRWLFESDALQIKCRHDFAAAAADFRGLYADPGV